MPAVFVEFYLTSTSLTVYCSLYIVSELHYADVN